MAPIHGAKTFATAPSAPNATAARPEPNATHHRRFRQRFVPGSPVPVEHDLFVDPVGLVPVLRQRDDGLALVARGQDRLVVGNEILIGRQLGKRVDPLLERLGGFGLGAGVGAGFGRVAEAFGLDPFRRRAHLDPPACLPEPTISRPR